MSAHEGVRGTVAGSVIAWCLAAVVLFPVALFVPASVGIAIAAVLMLGPLVVAAFWRRS